MPLDDLARRAEDDPFFLACPLKWYARSEAMSDSQLAIFLGCDAETLVKIRLCGTPEESRFKNDIAAIASRFDLNSSSLTKAVRRGIVTHQLQSAKNISMAARDRLKEDEP